MKKILTSILILSLSILFSSICYYCYSDSGSNVSAATWQDSYNVEFTFEPGISISLSSADLVISDLAPGTYSDSNVITVTTSTNSSGGYTLGASVGSSTYNTRSLIQDDISSVFDSIATDASLGTLTDPDTWGYAIRDGSSDSSGSGSSSSSTWSNYSGLPLYDSTDLTNVKELATGGQGVSTLDFKIAAYADSSMTSGEYNNIINFIATAEPEPINFARAFYEAAELDPTITKLNGYYKMQDMRSSICNNIDVVPSTMELIDTRDSKVYTVAKLADNKCWMTTNLDLAGGTALSSDDTDFDATWTLPTANGFEAGNTLPTSQVIVSDTTLDGGFTDDTQAYIFNSGKDECVNKDPCFSYYSWTTATLGSGLDITADNTDAPYSICPKNWRLPTTYYGINSTTDFRALAIVLGGSDDVQTYNSSTSPMGSSMYDSLISSPYSFVLSAGINNSEFTYNNGHGSYYTSTSASSTSAHRLRFNSTEIQFAGVSSRHAGSAVRCIANNS